MKILFLTTVLPYEKRTGGEIVSALIVNDLRQLGYEVKVLGYGRLGNIILINENDAMVAQKAIESSSSKKETLYYLFKAFMKRMPYSCAKYVSKEYVMAINDELRNRKYDLVIVDHAQMAWLVKYCIGYPIVLVAHNVEYDLYKKVSENTSFAKFYLKYLYYREYKLMFEIEKKLFGKVDQVWCLSSNDKNKIETESGVENIHVLQVPGGFDRLAVSKEKKYSVAILGTWTWEANRKGLVWFVNSVLPFLDNLIDVHIAGIGADWIVGKYPNVFCYGFVEDAQEFLSSAKCIVVASIEGGGIQVKTLNAISTGVPVVSTSIGVRGIEDIPKSVFVTDDPGIFAKRIEYLVRSNDVHGEGYNWSLKRRGIFTDKLGDLVKHAVTK